MTHGGGRGYPFTSSASRAETRGWLRTPALPSRSLASGAPSATSSRVDDLTFEVPRGTVTVLLGPERRGQDHRRAPRHRRAAPRRGRGAHARPRSRRRRRGHRGAPPLRRGAGPARALRPPVGHRQPRGTPPRSSRSTPRHMDERIAEAARPLRHRRRARPEGRRLLDRHAGAARAGRAPSCTNPTCCCSTSRPRASTPSRPARCSASSTRWPKTARPSSCARTCCSRPRGSPTRWS